MVPPCLVGLEVPLSPVDLQDLEVQALLFLHDGLEDQVDLNNERVEKCRQIFPQMPHHLYRGYIFPFHQLVFMPLLLQRPKP